MREPLDVVINRANETIRRSDDLLITAGKALQEIKERVTDLNSDEGKDWNWSWQAFCDSDIIKCSYSRAQQLISFILSPDPEQAIAEERARAADGMRRHREKQAKKDEWARKYQAKATAEWLRKKAKPSAGEEPFCNVTEPQGQEQGQDRGLAVWQLYLALDRNDRRRFDSLWLEEHSPHVHSKAA